MNRRKHRADRTGGICVRLRGAEDYCADGAKRAGGQRQLVPSADFLTDTHRSCQKGEEADMLRTTLKAAVAVYVILLGVAAADEDWSRVANALGRPGQTMPGGVYRVGLPRTDLHVTVDGITLKPTLALGSWLAFKESGPGQVMVMGDLVLTETEVKVRSPAVSEVV
jgi:Domain of Unknown Function (DUF1259)